MSSEEPYKYKTGFRIGVDSERVVLRVAVAGSVLSCIAVVFNVSVFLLMCRKRLFSPCTIIMQGLALADCFTALTSYCLEPLYQSLYFDLYTQNTLVYPYCILYVNLSQLVDSFHLLSLMLTACLGVQRVIAIKFPIWTRHHMTKFKAVVCCLVCLVITLSVSIPRHLALVFEKYFYGQCVVTYRNVDLIKYTTITYQFIHAALLVLLSLVMIICTFYISLKLLANRFRGRQSSTSVLVERKSAMMIIIVLVIFLIAEVPQLFINIAVTRKYFDGSYLQSVFEYSVDAVMDRRNIWAITLAYHTTYFSEIFPYDYYVDSQERFDFFLLVIEGIKMFTLIGCISNFIIYISMSKKFRREICEIFICRK